MKEPSVPYSGVPTVSAPADGSGARPSGVHATPEAFGSQIGEAMQKSGESGFDFAMKQQNMINETLMTNADAAFATKVGELKGKYTSLTGMAAFNAFPQYQEDVKSAFQEARAGLAPSAQRGFDLMAARSMANHVADGSSYASSQLKEAQRDSYSSLGNANVQALLDPAVAHDDERSNHHIENAAFAAKAQIDPDHPGLKSDPETGMVSFDEDTPHGQQLKAETQQRVDAYQSQAYLNRYTTLAKADVFSAWDKFQQEKDRIPPAGQVGVEAFLSPKLMAAHTQHATTSVLSEAHRDQFDQLTNPQRESSIATVLKNEGGMSPDGHAIYGIDKIAHPQQFAEAQKITNESGDAAGKKYAADFYKSEYYDKRGIAELPKETQSIVMDGVVNHSEQFGDKLVQAAKNGASPAELIGMRDREYDRLAQANPEKYGQYLQGWKNRLASFGEGAPAKSYATNEYGGPLTQADYYRTNSEKILARGDEYAESQMPGDLALKRAVRQSLTNHMSKVIANESAQHMLDNKNVMRAINGEMTNGHVPETEDDLRKIPGMGDLLDRVAAQDPKFAETIPKIVEKAARRNDTTNSSNGYETILRTLEPNDSASYPNGIRNQDQLARMMGHSDGTGINYKDYKDAKQAVELPEKFKTFLRKHMLSVTDANGNIDGMGQQRALQFYTSAMELYNAENKKGTPLADMMDPKSRSYIDVSGNFTPSRAEQISALAKRNASGQYVEGQTASNPKTGEKLTFRNGKWQ